MAAYPSGSSWRSSPHGAAPARSARRASSRDTGDPACREPERRVARRVQPLHVVDGHQHRPLLAELAEHLRDGEGHHVRLDR
jgi:hypothetical protein